MTLHVQPNIVRCRIVLRDILSVKGPMLKLSMLNGQNLLLLCDRTHLHVGVIMARYQIVSTW